MSAVSPNPTNAVCVTAQYALVSLAGVLISVGLPPLGWWPTMLIGIALYVVVTERAGRSARTQFGLALVFAWSWLAPAMGWMWHLVPGGFVVAPLLFALAHGTAAVIAVRIVPSTAARVTRSTAAGRTSTTFARVVVRMACHAVVECVRVVVPFGGVPLAGLALGVADTRLAHFVRLVGPLGLSLWLLVAGGVIAELWLQRTLVGWRIRRGVLLVLTVLVATQAIAQLVPHGRDTGQSMRIAVVQGGGPQGVLAINTNPRNVTLRHLAASALLQPDDDLDLVLWPENTIDVADFTTSKVRDDIAAEARRLGAPIVVGVTEDAGENFTNAQIVVDGAGNELSRYDKVRRVPYGEYIPLRSVLDALGAPVNRIPRDAVAGSTAAIIEVPTTVDAAATAVDATPPTDVVPLVVAISWEVFFASRVNDGVANGGQAVLNPTNGSSYTGEILHRQQVASSRLRALESGRFLVQAATTGYSIVVDSDGHVLQRIPIGKQAVIFHDVPLRTGRTPYSYLGDMPIVIFIVGLIIAIAVRTRRRAVAAASSSAV